MIRLADLPPELRSTPAAAPPGRRRDNKDLEQLAHALEVFEGSRSELARALGLSERTLYRRLKALGL